MANPLTWLEGMAERLGPRPALCLSGVTGDLVITYADLWKQAGEWAERFAAQGIGPGDRIAILSESRPEWGIAFFGILRAGAIAVPLDINLNVSELAPIAQDCEPRILLVSATHVETGRNLVRHLDYHLDLFRLEDGAPVSPMTAQPTPSPPAPVLEPHGVAAIVYTSGTTGRPKGVMTTFENIDFEVHRLTRRFGLLESDRILSILPLNHLLELTGALFCPLSVGATVFYTEELYPDEIARIIHDSEISASVGVPAFFRALRATIKAQVKNKGVSVFLGFQICHVAAAVLPRGFLRRLLFWPVLSRLGGSLRIFACGGAPLEIQVARFFIRMGIPILQGYGLTETSPVISLNGSDQNRLGSVGRPLDDVEVKIETPYPFGEGEILTRGPHVMKGYYEDPQRTREAIDEDGWFHTEDIGRLDPQGYLYITGRLKNVIVLNSGKKVQAEEVEIALSRGNGIKEICVVPVQSPLPDEGATETVCAVVVPTEEFADQFSGKESDLYGRLKTEVWYRANVLSPFKRPTKLVVCSTDLPKTPTLKIKHNEVRDWLNDVFSETGREGDITRPIPYIPPQNRAEKAIDGGEG